MEGLAAVGDTMIVRRGSEIGDIFQQHISHQFISPDQRVTHDQTTAYLRSLILRDSFKGSEFLEMRLFAVSALLHHAKN